MDDMDMEMKLNYSELESLWNFVNVHREKLGNGYVCLKSKSGSGIGTATTALIHYTEDEGVFKDITDYDKW